MKNMPKFITEFIITIAVASLLSSAVAFLLVFIVGNMGFYNQAYPMINTICGILWGVLVGYKLNSLIREHKA